MIDTKARLSEMVTKLKREGFRLTAQRLAVVKVLAANEEHLSVERIFDRVKADFPVTSLATVYKTVALLKRVGEVMELGFVDDSNRYDGTRPFPHPHLICTRCKRILDPDVPVLSNLPGELARKTGYRIDHHRLDFFGLCPKCQRASASN
jgi:Fur family transcriptional regulator, peroxide stress response regulator